MPSAAPGLATVRTTGPAPTIMRASVKLVGTPCYQPEAPDDRLCERPYKGWRRRQGKAAPRFSVQAQELQQASWQGADADVCLRQKMRTPLPAEYARHRRKESSRLKNHCRLRTGKGILPLRDALRRTYGARKASLARFPFWNLHGSAVCSSVATTRQ